MIKILVGSNNPVKINAVKEAFGKFFKNIEVSGMNADSKVPHQPINEETFDGAKNRALFLKDISEKTKMNADYFVGIEGGISKFLNLWFAFGLMCIIDKDGLIGFGTSPLFELPESIIKELLNGVELGYIIDKISGENNTKQKSGAIGFLTNGVMNRTDIYVHGLISALIPFLHKDIYFEGKYGK